MQASCNKQAQHVLIASPEATSCFIPTPQPFMQLPPTLMASAGTCPPNPDSAKSSTQPSTQLNRTHSATQLHSIQLSSTLFCKLPTTLMLSAGASPLPAKECGHQPVRGRRHCGLQPAHSQLEVAAAPGPLHGPHSIPSLHLLSAHTGRFEQGRQDGDCRGHFDGETF